MRYADRIKLILTTKERALFKRLSTPIKIQDYLDTLPINFEVTGETYLSPRLVLQRKTAHCMEGALLAAAALAYHGAKPQLLDLQTAAEDDDHVVALFQQGGRWGAISKTNHAILRYRDPVYASVRELALSYFHEYFLEENGKKTLRAYSAPFDLSRFAPEKWMTATEDLDWLAGELDWSRHFPIVSKKVLRALRPASKVERRAISLTEWTRGGRSTGSR